MTSDLEAIRKVLRRCIISGVASTFRIGSYSGLQLYALHLKEMVRVFP
jgi:hypothetical protein